MKKLFFALCVAITMMSAISTSARAGIGLGGGTVNVLGTTNIVYATNFYVITTPSFNLTLGNVTNPASQFIGSINASIVATNLSSFTNQYSAGAGTNGYTTNFTGVNYTIQVIQSYQVQTGTNTIPVLAN